MAPGYDNHKKKIKVSYDTLRSTEAPVTFLSVDIKAIVDIVSTREAVTPPWSVPLIFSCSFCTSSLATHLPSPPDKIFTLIKKEKSSIGTTQSFIYTI